MGCQYPPSLNTFRRSESRPGLPPVIAVTSTVCPVVKSKTCVLGVDSNGSPSWFTVGAPSSRVQLVTKLNRSTGDQFAPPPSTESVPKPESWFTSAFALSVRLPRALKSRPLRDTGRSKFAPTSPSVRLSELELDRPAILFALSRCWVLAPMRKVAPALPAGTLNKLPLVTTVKSPEVVVFRARSKRKSGLSRSVSVTLRAQSALPVMFQCHSDLSQLRVTPAWALFAVVSRASGSSVMSL